MISFLESKGYVVTILIGRDGWTLQWAGSPVTLIQSNGNVTSTEYCEDVDSQSVRLDQCTIKALVNGIVSGIVGDGTCDCDENTVCTQVNAFDYDRGLVAIGQTTAYRMILDTVTQSTVVHDYTTTSDGTNVSTYYDPIIAAINAVPGWSMTLVTDVLQTNQGKPTWRVEYTGAGPSELIIQNATSVAGLGNGDSYIFRVDASGVMTTAVISGGGAEQPDFNSPVFSAC